jgi:RimJ/RimL family protein N-acetyltransferase
MFARTERLLLRPGWGDDAIPLRDAIAHKEVAYRLARLPWPYTLGDAQYYLSLPHRIGEASFLIFARAGSIPELVGGIGIHDQGGAPELGYWITPAQWGKGYATEAARAVVAIAHHSLRMPRLVSGHFVDNPASGRVLRKLGFKPTGKVEGRTCLARGSIEPCALYELELADDGGSEVPTMMSHALAA